MQQRAAAMQGATEVVFGVARSELSVIVGKNGSSESSLVEHPQGEQWCMIVWLL